MSPSTGNIPSNHRGATLLPSGVPIGDSLIVPRAPSKVVSLRNQRLLGRQRFLRPVSPGHSRITPRPTKRASKSPLRQATFPRTAAVPPSCRPVPKSATASSCPARPAKRCPYAINLYLADSGSSPLPVRYPPATAASRPARPAKRASNCPLPQATFPRTTAAPPSCRPVPKSATASSCPARPAKRCPYAINVYSVASGSSPLPVRYPRATAASRPARLTDRVSTPSSRAHCHPSIGSHPRRPHSSAARPLPPI